MQFLLKLLMHREISISIEIGLKIGWVNVHQQKLISVWNARMPVWNAKISGTSRKQTSETKCPIVEDD